MEQAVETVLAAPQAGLSDLREVHIAQMAFDEALREAQMDLKDERQAREDIRSGLLIAMPLTGALASAGIVYGESSDKFPAGKPMLIGVAVGLLLEGVGLLWEFGVRRETHS